jgi:uncharacterized protein (TIGR00369 family)
VATDTPRPERAFDVVAAQATLQEGFAPWVGELGLRVEHVGEDGARVRMPFSPRLCRAGDIVCGQAFSALADTAAVLGLFAGDDAMTPCTTVDMTVQMMRPVSDDDVVATATVLRRGRSLAFMQVLLHADGDGRPAVHAAVTLALV